MYPASQGSEPVLKRHTRCNRERLGKVTKKTIRRQEVKPQTAKLSVLPLNSPGEKEKREVIEGHGPLKN